MNRHERREAARKSRIASSPEGAVAAPAPSPPTPDAEALCATGLAHLSAGRRLDAQICCQQALTIDPGHADSLHLMGLLAFDSQHYDHALEFIARAIRRDPKPNYCSTLGATLLRQNRPAEALQAFEKAIQLAPENAEFWKNRGYAQLALQRHDDALTSFQHVLTLNPRHQDAAYNIGILLHHAGRFEEALIHLTLCDEAQPDHAPTLRARAASLHDLKRFEEALVCGQRADVLEPGDAATCNTVAASLLALGREQEALPWFELALQTLPRSTEILNNIAYLLGQLQRFDEAFAFYRHIEAQGLNDALTRWNLSLLQMLTGDFEAGWAGREARWTKTDPIPYPRFGQPMWLGREPVDGKTVLVHVDEGLGDTIQFVRFLPMLAKLGARVILVADRRLQALLAGLPGVTQCLAFGVDPLPAFDMHCPIGSLPLAFATRLESIPSQTSYLPRPAEARIQAWENRLGPRHKLRIGLVWSGNPSHRNDHNRSIALQALTPLLDLDATFVSLQRDIRTSDQAVLAQTAIVDLTAGLADFADTAALVSCLDLVISVDTSVAHLAAALGCPTWILLPYTPDYRWLLERDDSPWYPTVKLFRQTADRDYGPVLDQVRAELTAIIAAS
jgi:tetratricopeptide (TPR) repeat protein